MKPIGPALSGTLLPLLLPYVSAQVVTLSATSGLTFIQGSNTASITYQTGVPTGTYHSYASQITLQNVSSLNSTISLSAESTTLTGTASETVSTTTSTIASTTVSGSRNGTQSATPAQPTNTQSCNNYVEFCNRKYSNITMVGCHNSPFVRPGSSASNQQLDVTAQLNDGIRFLQGQMQFPANSTVPHFCHTSCDLLDVGPITDWLTDVFTWVDAHPYDVVTILLENGNYSQPSVYVPYIQSTGILKYTYEAPYLPMKLNDWPTLETLIIHGKRVIMFLDYMADQTKFPWLLDEFSQVWETPFDPTDRTFPCTVQRPPDLSGADTRDRMYLMNHNLNVEFNVFGASVLVPAVSLLNETNADSGYGSVGLAADGCRASWGRAPNILNVDYYNYGTPAGSVFEAAATMNNVTYKGGCCGTVSNGASALSASLCVFVASLLVACLLL